MAEQRNSLKREFFDKVWGGTVWSLNIDAAGPLARGPAVLNAYDAVDFSQLYSSGWNPNGDTPRNAEGDLKMKAKLVGMLATVIAAFQFSQGIDVALADTTCFSLSNTCNNNNNNVNNTGTGAGASNAATGTGATSAAVGDNGTASTGASSSAMHDNGTVATGASSAAQRADGNAATGPQSAAARDNGTAASGNGAIAARDSNHNFGVSSQGGSASFSYQEAVTSSTLSGTVSNNSVSVTAGTNSSGASSAGPATGVAGLGINSINSAFSGAAGITQAAQNAGHNDLIQQNVTVSATSPIATTPRTNP